MSEVNHQFYLLLSACAGNWRNCVYIPADDAGYLLSADRDGQPILMAVQQFQQLTGEQIDPAECCGQLSAEGFKRLYAQYLLWYLPSDSGNPLVQLCQLQVAQ